MKIFFRISGIRPRNFRTIYENSRILRKFMHYYYYNSRILQKFRNFIPKIRKRYFQGWGERVPPIDFECIHRKKYTINTLKINKLLHGESFRLLFTLLSFGANMSIF